MTDQASNNPSIRNGLYPLDKVDLLEEATMSKVEAYVAQRAAANKHNNCTLENAAVRREWCVYAGTAMLVLTY